MDIYVMKGNICDVADIFPQIYPIFLSVFWSPIDVFHFAKYSFLSRK